MDILGNESIEIFEERNEKELTLHNIFEKIQKHDRFPNYYSKYLKEDIIFMSEHFFEIKEDQEEFQNLSITIFN